MAEEIGIEKEENKSSIGGMIAVWFAVSALVMTILFMIDWACFQNRYLAEILYGDNCEMVVPNGYKILYSKQNNAWCVKVGDGDEYLWDGGYRISTMYSNISKPTMFLDSCTAKAFLQAYLDEQAPKINDAN